MKPKKANAYATAELHTTRTTHAVLISKLRCHISRSTQLQMFTKLPF